MLISGVSFAGLAPAFWLNRLGYRVTIVEVVAGLRREVVETLVNMAGTSHAGAFDEVTEADLASRTASTLRASSLRHCCRSSRTVAVS